MVRRRLLPAIAYLLVASSAAAQVAPDAAAIRARLRSGDSETERFAVLEIGRLERPSFIPLIVPFLRSPLPEIRAQAADAIGQAARGWLSTPPAPRDPFPLASVVEVLTARLKVESEPAVRASITETIGRLPYVTSGQVAAAALALAQAASTETVSDRLGIAKGLEALVRLSRPLALPIADDVVTRLRGFVASEASRDARVRRLALSALITIGAVDDTTLARAAGDPDNQVRRLAMRAAMLAPGQAASETLIRGLSDVAAMVRLEALAAISAIAGTNGDSMCQTARVATGDRDVHVVLLAFDELARCREDADVRVLERAVIDLSEAGTPRGWHKAAHAIVALATAAPDRGRSALPQFVDSKNWPLRMYAARAAAALKDQATLERLAGDDNERVKEAAIDGLRALGAYPDSPKPRNRAPVAPEPSAADIRGLSLLQARVVVRNVGTFEMALLAREAPEAVARVVSLARSGQLDGLVIRRVVANSRVEAGGGTIEPGGDALPLPKEVGLWPHVRGSVGIDADSTFFIDVVDNPQFDHQYTVFAQLVDGMDVVDDLLEGDVIERIDIVKP
jgi:cyclophilin family peptidyl-prolyl cis-trans isomerase/HEAT repeat protein